MQEALLHFIWDQLLFENKEYTADTGEKILILDTGKHNFDGGPDFTNARISIDGTIWAGNVEIHIKLSDWQNHGHHKDASYNNVILHIAENNDSTCMNLLQRRIPSIKLTFDPEIEVKYNKLLGCENLISCSDSLDKVESSLFYFWFSALAIERLYSRTKFISELLPAVQNSWEEAFYISLARSFGLNINSLPFELMAKSIPLKILSRHNENLFQLESLIFGQAGFLEGEVSDDYHLGLQKEYQFLKNKYKLKNIEPHLWKFLRLRPSNFPTMRLAEFCALIFNSKNLFSKIIECKNCEQIYKIFMYKVSNYWKNHYTFGNESNFKEKRLGSQAIDSIIINVIVPFMFVYGEQKNKEDLKECAIKLLETISPENNHIIRKWKEYKIFSRNATDTQALLQLTQEYCIKKRCLNCQIGNLILRKIQQ